MWSIVDHSSCCLSGSCANAITNVILIIDMSPSEYMESVTTGELEDFSPSVKFVHHVLKEGGHVGRSELIDTTKLPEATVDWAIDQLDEAGLLVRRRDPHAPRRVVYRLSETEPPAYERQMSNAV